MVRDFQSAWIFLQHATWDIGDLFAGVENMIHETFLPRFSFIKTKTLPPIVGALSMMPVRKAVLGLLSPVTSAQEKYSSSTQGSAKLTRSVMGGGEFSNANHLRTLSEERRDGKEARDVAYKSRLKGLVRYLKATENHPILRAKSTGAWMSIRGTTVSVTVLSAT